MSELFMDREACISDCGTYRYSLARTWGTGPKCVFIMLNPSTADAVQDDPTVRRCIRFASDWGHKMLVVLNLFALRSPNPEDIVDNAAAGIDPIGRDNDDAIRRECMNAGTVVVAWGVHGAMFGRDKEVLAILDAALVPTYVLGLTKNGHPRHPLYVQASAKPEPWPKEKR